MFGNMKVRGRLLIMMGFMLAAMAAVTLYALMSEKSTMLEDRKVKTRHLVEVATGIAEHYYKLQQTGAMAEAEAKSAAIDTIKALRYEKDDYFWVNDLHPRMVMHPTKPELDGQDLSDNKDPDGKPLFVEMVKTVQQQGAGYVFYLWPKPGQSNPVAKVSYVKGFAPWGWVVGSGIYIDDVNDIYWNRVWSLLAINLAGAALAAAAMYVIGRSITRPIEAMDEAVTRIGEHSDLSTRIEVDDNGEIGEMARHLNQTLEQVGNSMRQVLDVAEKVSSKAEQLAVTTAELTSGSNAQASAAAEMAAAVEEVTVSIGEVAANAEAAEHLSKESATLVGRGGEVVGNAAAEMSRTSEMVSESARRIMELSEHSQQISGIARVINEIANQTNLLALNAAIEAARAGESGRGFAVVADEVRKLAERTAAATAEISTLISSIQNNTASAVDSMETSSAQANKGMALAGEAGQAFSEISASSQRTVERVRDISMSSHEQNSASQSIAVNVEKIAQMTEENSAATASVDESTNQLKELAGTLMQAISRFKV